jgi:hypothetical protein
MGEGEDALTPALSHRMGEGEDELAGLQKPMCYSLCAGCDPAPFFSRRANFPGSVRLALVSRCAAVEKRQQAKFDGERVFGEFRLRKKMLQKVRSILE